MGSFQDPAVFLHSHRAGLAQALVAQVYIVTAAELRAPTRGRPRAARARQVAMYLARGVFAMSRAQLAAEFGRDRTTVLHACEVVSRLRQEDGQFDETLCWMESQLRRAAGLNP